jgi:putative ABC transport system permease protein
MSVVVLGPEAADTIFGRHDGVVGETIRIEGQPFRVIGVLVPRGGGAFGSEDGEAYIPFTTAQARLIKRGSRDEVDVLFVQATTAEAVPQASEEIANILRQRHRTPIGDDDFTVFTQQDFLQTLKRYGCPHNIPGGIGNFPAGRRYRYYEYHARFDTNAPQIGLRKVRVGAYIVIQF